MERKPDESAQSVVLRLAPLCLASVEEFLRYALNFFSRLHSLPARIETLWRLAEVAGLDPAIVQEQKIEPTRSGFLIYQREVPADWINLEVRRVAPGVLSADDIPYHRVAWQPNPLECDVPSGEVLLDRCPRCDAFLGWHKIESVAVCGACRFDIRDHPPTFVPSDRLALAQELLEYLHGAADQIPAPFRTLDDISTAYAMEWLAYFTDLPNGKYLRPDFSNAAVGLNELKRWPSSFDEVVTHFLSDSAAPFLPGRPSKARLIPLLTGAIERAGTPPLRQVLLDRVIDLLGKSSLSDMAVGDRIFGSQNDIRVSDDRKDHSPLLRDVFRMDSMRAIQSATSLKPRGS
jgi:hypothetical protein